MDNSLALAASSELAAAAGRAMAEAGGNAVDAAIAAILVSINTEPGVCSLACGGYMTVWQAGRPPVTLDGYVAAPGAGPRVPERPRHSVDVDLEYGGGIRTTVGPDSVGVPGGVALFGEGSQRYGRLPWATLFEPVVDIVRAGFPLPRASHLYLVHSGEPIFSRSADGRAALYTDEGRLREAGETIHVPHLADSLEHLARCGPADFYTGELGQALTGYLQDNGGRLSPADMQQYAVISRPCLEIRSDSAAPAWTIATNPPPAIGGAVLAAMLTMLNRRPVQAWDDESFRYLIDVQRAVLGYRAQRLDLSDSLTEDAHALLELAARSAPASILESGSTCHVSAVDAQGLACAITVSSGYGSGDMPPGTGIWLNNCLGELELNHRGLEVGPPGVRLPSNMAPTVARSDEDTLLAIGSPGASRITTAILQVLINHIQLGMPLDAAVAAPRAHVELDGTPTAACEPGLPVEALTIPVRAFDELSMYFGGVGAASWSPRHGFAVAADPRRTGGTWVGP